MPDAMDIQEVPVYSYALASADMRYIEIEKRDIYLRDDPEYGLVFRGEIFGCGTGCFVDLSEILLEYAMSCEGCREEGVASKEVIRFGERLGEILVAKTHHAIANSTIPEKLSSSFKRILNSMSTTFIEEIKEDHLQYSLDCCPLSECAKTTGLSRNAEIASVSFIALCKSVIKALAPDWVLTQPQEGVSTLPLHTIVVAKA